MQNLYTGVQCCNQLSNYARLDAVCIPFGLHHQLSTVVGSRA